MPSSSRWDVPRNWIRAIQAALIQVMALAQYACTRVRAEEPHAAQTDQLEQEIALLREEVRLKDARMERMAAAPDGRTTNRPNAPPSWSCVPSAAGRWRKQRGAFR